MRDNQNTIGKSLSKESQEDYLEAIYLVNQRLGFCRSVDLATEMGYSKASVSRAVAKLKEKNLIYMDSAGKLILNEDGKKVAEYTLKKHKLIKGILCDIGVNEQSADEQACRIEHIISEETFQCLAERRGTD